MYVLGSSDEQPYPQRTPRFSLSPIVSKALLEVCTLISTDSVAVPSQTALRVLEVDFREDPRWNEFISAHPDALIYHHPGWLSALEAEYHQKCVSLACEDADGRFCAILPLFYTKGLPLNIGGMATGRRLSSLPRTPMAGPLSVSDQAATAIVEYAVALAASQRGVQLEIKTHVPDLEKSVESLSCTPWRATYVEELPPVVEGAGWEEFWENLRIPRTCVSCEGCRRLRFGNAKRQHRVNWAEEDLARWYPLYLLAMRHNAVPPRSYRFFRALWSSLRSCGGMRLLLAEREQAGQTRTIAGSILLQFGQTVFYAFTGCAPGDFCLHPHDILQIEAIRGACRSGFRWYDFGEVTEDHEALAQFKTKWGGDPTPLFRYYYPTPKREISGRESKFGASARKLWRSLPPKATAVLGDLIYSRM
jgi:hypothetical protein